MQRPHSARSDRINKLFEFQIKALRLIPKDRMPCFFIQGYPGMGDDFSGSPAGFKLHRAILGSVRDPNGLVIDDNTSSFVICLLKIP